MKTTPAFLFLAALALGSCAAEEPAAGPKAEAKSEPKKEGKSLTLRQVVISGEYPERPGGGPFGMGKRSFHGLLEILDRVKADAKADGVYLNLQHSSLEWAQIEEVGAKLKELRAAGKKVYAFLDRGSAGSYLIACHCDAVGIPPSVSLDLQGFRAEVTYFKGLLDKLGVEFQTVRAGKYKSAIEPLTQDAPSAATDEMMNALLDDTADRFAQAVKAGRGLEEKRARELMDEGPFLAAEALKAGLVDCVGYEDQFFSWVRAKAGVDAVGVLRGETQPRSQGLGAFLALFREEPVSPRVPKIAVLVAEGTIGGDDGLLSLASGVTEPEMVKAIRELRDDPSVKGVVLRINSPGGDATVSDLIWRELVRLREKKPLVASMSNVCASGGYYLACAAQEIYASPGTITGSIGVFGLRPNARELMAKLGVTRKIYARGKHAHFGAADRPMDAEEKGMIEKMIQDFYAQFLAKVADNRKKTPDEIHAIAQGRVWTGRQAKENGLVDGWLGLDGAIRKVKEKTGIADDPKAAVVFYPKEKSLLDLLSGGSEASLEAIGLRLLPAEFRGPARFWEWAARRPGVYALMPFAVAVR